jgi:signal transduction histidine kinase
MRRFLTISVVLPTVTCVLIAALLADVVGDAGRAWRSRTQAEHVFVVVDVVKDLSIAAINIRLERGAVNFALSAAEPSGAETHNTIATLRVESAKNLDAALSKLATQKAIVITAELGEFEQAFNRFDVLRHEADAALKQMSDQRPPSFRGNWSASNDKLTAAIDRLIDNLTGSSSIADAAIADMLRIAQKTWKLREAVGNDRFLFTSRARMGGALSEEERQMFAVSAGEITAQWKLIEDEIRLQAAPLQFREALDTVNRIYFRELPLKRQFVVNDLASDGRAVSSLTEWRDLAVPAQAAMVSVMNSALDIADAKAVAAQEAARTALYKELLLMIVIFAIGAITILYVFKDIVAPIKKISRFMCLVADGKLAFDIPYEHRVDEIGLLAHALRVFRDDEIEKQRLLIEKEGAEAASRAKSKFLANMSHELRTPLNAIIGFAEMIKTAMLGPLSERYRSYGADIFNSGTHLLGLINEILDLAKLEAGKLELQEEEIDLAATVEACMTIVEGQAHLARVRLSADTDSTVLKIRADERRLRQILINLLSNAVKFTPEDGDVRVSCSRRDRTLAIMISDTGIGIAPEDVPKAMMAFGQVESKVSRKVEGTGLGLPLVQHLVELHGGKLTIESEVDVGTRVTVTLPLERIIDTSPPQPAATMMV